MRYLLEPVAKPRDIFGADFRHMGGNGLVIIAAPVAVASACVDTFEGKIKPQMCRDRGKILVKMLYPHEMPCPLAA
jgi:hypothetical protein